jgi:hypothetical protein
MNSKSKSDLRYLRNRKILSVVSILFVIILVSSVFVYMVNGVSAFETRPTNIVSNEIKLKNPILIALHNKAICVVNNEAELKSAVVTATGATIIALDGDISLTESFIVPANKDITLTSNTEMGSYKLIGADGVNTVFVEGSGVLRLEDIIITHPTGISGRGVEVYFGGTLIMTGGMVCNNIDWGGVLNCGSFSMYGGEISGNTAVGSGGGVYNNGYDFSMYSGKISNNTAVGSGGGVYNLNGKVHLYDGVISGNNAKVGGGVDIFYGSFYMSGGLISGNIAKDKGGGVYNYYYSVFSLSGSGEISNNTAPLGDGVCNDGDFKRNGGEISGNTVYYSDGAISW